MKACVGRTKEKLKKRDKEILFPCYANRFTHAEYMDYHVTGLYCMLMLLFLFFLVTFSLVILCEGGKHQFGELQSAVQSQVNYLEFMLSKLKHFKFPQYGTDKGNKGNILPKLFMLLYWQ